MGKNRQREQKKMHCCEGEPSLSSNYRLPLNSEAPPRLLFFLGERGKTQAFLRMSDGMCEIRRYSNVRGCLATPQGWLVGTTEDEHRKLMLCLINPASLEKIYVPHPPLSGCLLRCFILSHPPADPDSRLVALQHGHSPHIYSWKLHGSGSEVNHEGHKWQRHRLITSVRIHSAVSTKQGQIYVLSFWCDLFKFEPKAKRHSQFINVIEEPGFDWQRQFQVKLLVEWCEEIYMVLMCCIRGASPRTPYFKVYKAVFSEEPKWMRVSSLNGAAFFLDGDMALACGGNGTSDSFKNNCIYYILRNDRNIYCYSMKDGCTIRAQPRQSICHKHFSPKWVVTPPYSSADQEEG